MCRIYSVDRVAFRTLMWSSLWERRLDWNGSEESDHGYCNWVCTSRAQNDRSRCNLWWCFAVVWRSMYYSRLQVIQSTENRDDRDRDGDGRWEKIWGVRSWVPVTRNARLNLVMGYKNSSSCNIFDVWFADNYHLWHSFKTLICFHALNNIMRNEVVFIFIRSHW